MSLTLTTGEIPYSSSRTGQPESSFVLEAASRAEQQFLHDVIINASYVDVTGNRSILEGEENELNLKVETISALNRVSTVAASQKAFELATEISDKSLDIAPILERVLLSKWQTTLMEGIVVGSFSHLSMSVRTGTSPLAFEGKDQFREIAKRANKYRDALKKAFQETVFLPGVIFGYTGRLSPSLLPN